MKKIIIYTILSLIALSSSVLLVYAASVKLDVDKDKVDTYKALTGETDADLTLIINEHMDKKIEEAVASIRRNEYVELGTHLQQSYSGGNIAEFDRIYQCVFP